MNRESFESTIVPEIAALHRFLRRIGVREADLDDVVQEVLIAVVQRWNDYDQSRPFRPWLYAFASRLASSWRRSARSTRESLSTSDEARVDEGMTNPDPIEVQQRRRLVLDALQSLDEDQRVVFVMIELEDMTAPVVASALGTNLNTVYSRLRLARAAFTTAVRRLALQRGAP